MSPQLRYCLAYITVGILRGANDARLRIQCHSRNVGGSGPTYCSADYSDDRMAGFRRSQLLTTTKVEKSIAAGANRSCCGHLEQVRGSAEISYWGAFVRRNFQGRRVQVRGLGNDGLQVLRPTYFCVSR
jgi:hypothetical protein